MAFTLVMGAFVALLLATLIGGRQLLLTWARKHGPPPRTHGANPAAWFAYWFPLLLVLQIWVFAATLALVALIELVWRIQGHEASPYTQLGFALGLSFWAIFAIAWDVWLMLRNRRYRRLQSGQ